jgi:hypothetical protein
MNIVILRTLSSTGRLNGRLGGIMRMIGAVLALVVGVGVAANAQTKTAQMKGGTAFSAFNSRVDNFDQAMTVALLASVSSELSVNEYKRRQSRAAGGTCQELPGGHRRDPQAGSGRSRSQEVQGSLVLV